MAYDGLNKYMDAAAELGRNPVSKHQMEQADAGRDGRTRFARPKSQARTDINSPCSAEHTNITVLLLPLHFIKGPFINSNTAALSFAVWSYLPPDHTMQSSCLVTTLSSGSRDRESRVIWPKGQGDLSICCGKKEKI